MAFLNEVDRLTGIERCPGSDAFGDLVCPVIILWKSPGGPNRGDDVLGALKVGADVRVVERRKKAGSLWFRVESIDGDPIQAGWLKAPFLERLGAEEAKRGLS
jgi:hypothetical protein